MFSFGRVEALVEWVFSRRVAVKVGFSSPTSIFYFGFDNGKRDDRWFMDTLRTKWWRAIFKPIYSLTLYSAFLLSVLRVRAHGRLVLGKVAQDIPILHKALWGKAGRIKRAWHASTDVFCHVPGTRSRFCVHDPVVYTWAGGGREARKRVVIPKHVGR